MKLIININWVLSLLLLCQWSSAQLVGKAVYGDFILKDATIVTVTNGIIKGDVLIQDGMISEVGTITKSNDAQVIDCTDKFIYPGFIDSGSGVGLHEISSISLSNDGDESGDLTPNAKALTAINPNSILIPVTRVSGVTSILAKPTRGLFPGTGALIDLWGYTPKQMYMGRELMLMNFPVSGLRHRFDRREKDVVEKEYVKEMKLLNDYWDKAKQYAELYEATGGVVDYNPELDAFRPVLSGGQLIVIHVNKEKDILKAIDWVEKNKLNVVFSGVREGYMVADSIAKANIPVVVGPILSLPTRANAAYDSSYKNAGILHKAGVKIAIQTNENENTRNLPYHAGFAAAYGLGTEEALKAITINPAEIFGLDASYGSIEEGKIANLFIADGDPFETKTSVEQVFIRGFMIPMESRHSLLYDEFLERNPGLSK